MAQVIASAFGLTLTAFVFFADKFKESAKGDPTYYDATIFLLNRFYFMLIIIAATSGVTILLCITGIIALHNWGAPYPFVINESVLLFIISTVAVLIFGVMLLDPGKLDKEISKMKAEAEDFYQTSDTKGSEMGDFQDFLKTYNSLEKTILDFAQQFIQDPSYESSNTRKFKPQIIQSLKVLLAREIINAPLFEELNKLRLYRNALVHGDDFTVPLTVCKRISRIESALSRALEVFRNENVADREDVVKKLHDLGEESLTTLQ